MNNPDIPSGASRPGPLAGLRRWSVFRHIRQPGGSTVLNDPHDGRLYGIRYGLAESELILDAGTEPQPVTRFDFEIWHYAASGAVEHQSLLQFLLLERKFPDLRVHNYMKDLRIFNRPFELSERNIYGALRAASRMISAIDAEDYIDGPSLLADYELIPRTQQAVKEDVPHIRLALGAAQSFWT